MKRNPLIYVISALVAIIVILMLFTFQVRQSEVVVVTTFGKPTATPKKNPGLYFRLPWGIQMIHRFDQRTQNFEDRLTEGLTHDSYALLTSVYVGWKITEPTAFFPRFAGSSDPIAEAEKVLDRIVSNRKAAVVGKHPLADFVSSSDGGTNFANIEREILTAVQTEVQSQGYGLEVDFLGFKKIALPESVTQTVFDRMTAERKVLADKSQYEGESKANEIRSDADRKSAEMITEAESKATQIRGLGEAEAAKSLSVFNQNPELANYIFRLNALENSLKERSILVLDRYTPPFDLFSGISTNLTNAK